MSRAKTSRENQPPGTRARATPELSCGFPRDRPPGPACQPLAALPPAS